MSTIWTALPHKSFKKTPQSRGFCLGLDYSVELHAGKLGFGDLDAWSLHRDELAKARSRRQHGLVEGLEESD